MRTPFIKPRIGSTRRDREIDLNALDKMFEELRDDAEDARAAQGGTKVRPMLGPDTAGTGISRGAVAGYLALFPRELQESALIDLLEVVTTELLARQRPAQAPPDLSASAR